MMGPSWTVPMEAVRDAADISGALIMAKHDGQFAKWEPHARIESTPRGFVAFVGYQLSPYNGMICTATVTLRWVAKENAIPAAPFGMPLAMPSAPAAEVRAS